ncbi:hypothetical protein GCM10028792_18630 [Salinisphaera aquimarina]
MDGSEGAVRVVRRVQLRYERTPQRSAIRCRAAAKSDQLGELLAYNVLNANRLSSRLFQ